MKFLHTILLSSLSLTAVAEPITITSTMPCDESKVIIDYLTKNYKEVPLLTGKAEDEVGSLMSFWVNTKTGTWTIVATKNKLSCIVGVGKNLKIIDSGPTV
jgi:hypothetical protein